MNLRIVFLASVFAAVACGSSQPAQQQQPPPQGYYPQQQPPPPPPPAQAPPPAAPPPATQPTATGAPAATGSAGTPTSIPGVMKNPDGTCSLTPPGMNGQPGGGAPIVGPCPPGI